MWFRRRKDDDDLQEALRLIETLEKRVEVQGELIDEIADAVARLEHESGRPLEKWLARRRKRG